MITKPYLLSHLKKIKRDYYLRDNDVIVGGKGVMLLNDLVEYSNDIDIWITPKVFNDILNRPRVKVRYFDSTFTGPNTPKLILSEHCEAFEYTNEPTEYVSGIRCWTLQYLLSFKQSLNREKDQEDIRLIKDKLNT